MSDEQNNPTNELAELREVRFMTASPEAERKLGEAARAAVAALRFLDPEMRAAGPLRRPESSRRLSAQCAPPRVRSARRSHDAPRARGGQESRPRRALRERRAQ